ncbi:MAG: tetratricopeptide repeat protein, partial [Ignavibacteriales bacterium]|nr:tetratricopeptide repeat protein [Ignavibacteriales bacterium]
MKLIFVFILSGISLFGGYNLDSLLRTIQPLPDTVQIRILNEACWNNRSNNTVAAIAAGEKALEIARKIANKALEARTLNLLGVVNRSYGNNNKSLFYLNEALRIALESNNQTEIAYSENNIGGSYRMKAYFTLAFQHVATALRIFESLNDSAGLSYSLINVGFIYQGQRNSVKALEYFQQTYDIREKLKDSAGMLIALGEIARTQNDLGEYQKALHNFNFIAEQSERNQDPSLRIRADFGLGEVYIAQKDFVKASKYLLNAYNTSKNIGNVSSIIRVAER